MREIKFRAWWVFEEKMLYNVHLFYDTLGDREHGNDYEPERSFGDLLCSKKYIPMQYTGLKDKNGKEIYEGDIVSIDGGAENPTFGEVIFEYGCFCFKAPWIKGNKYCPELKAYIDMSFCELEIIGNIYENPELLEKANER